MVWRIRSRQKNLQFRGRGSFAGGCVAQVEVRYQAMRLNRALNVWNVEAVLENKGTRVLQGPVVLLVDSFSGTTGPLQTDGADDGTPAKKFYELSASLKEAKLSPGEKATARTLTLGVSTGVPKLVTKVFAARAKPPLALALVRTLDQAGQPLTNVKIEEIGPNGTASLVSDPNFGVATLGQGSGGHVWKFSKVGASGKADYLQAARPASRSSSARAACQTPWCACVGGGRTPSASSTPSSRTPTSRCWGAEAGGDEPATPRRLSSGASPCSTARAYVLAYADGQVLESHSSRPVSTIPASGRSTR